MANEGKKWSDGSILESTTLADNDQFLIIQASSGQSKRIKAKNNTTYKKYVALLTQIGNAAPSIVSNGTGANTPLENTLGGTIVWARTGAGAYTGTLVGAFTADKTFLFPSQSQTNDTFVTMSRASADVVNLSTLNAAQTVLGDSKLNTTPIEIRVYSS